MGTVTVGARIARTGWESVSAGTRLGLSLLGCEGAGAIITRAWCGLSLLGMGAIFRAW